MCDAPYHSTKILLSDPLHSQAEEKADLARVTRYIVYSPRMPFHYPQAFDLWPPDQKRPGIYLHLVAVLR